MANIDFQKAFNLIQLEIPDITGGTATIVSSTEIDLANAPYTGQLYGSQLDTGFGFVNEFDAQISGHDLFKITGLNVNEITLYNDRHNQDAILNDLFGGNDIETGSQQADGLAGFAGNDILKGHKGGDTLVGGDGADRLDGGPDGDSFRYNHISESVKGSRDTIVNIGADDVIDLQNLDVQGRIITTYNAKHDLTIVHINVDGQGKADMDIALTGHHTTSDLHFLI